MLSKKESNRIQYERMQVGKLCRHLETDSVRGLSATQAAERLFLDGPNEITDVGQKSMLVLFFSQLADPLIYVLIVAAGISVFLGEVSDAAIIGAVVVLNAIVGMLQEGKARKALESLKKLASPKAIVIRDGVRLEIPSAELVRGDLVCLEAGCQVSADVRLISCSNLKIEESALTGESMPMEKDASFCPPDAGRDVEIPLGDRPNMAYMSTLVTCGHGSGIVTAVGMDTELGRIASMISDGKEEMTPLQRRLGDLGRVLSLLSLLLCGGLFFIAILQHRDVPEMLITAISLAVAAVPEGLPAVVTICLALSVTRMVRANTIIRRLPSVETLGAVSVVCSDKTGTLTQNRMRVEACFVGGRMLTREAGKMRSQADDLTREKGEPAREKDGMVRKGDELAREISKMARGGPGQSFLAGMVLCNDAVITKENRMGDPTELALVELAAECGVRKEEWERTYLRTDEIPFDSDRKMMTTQHGETAYTKGAPDEVVKKCDRIWTQDGIVPLNAFWCSRIQEALAEMTGNALRTLAVAMWTGKGVAPEDNMVLLGIVGMQDPVRDEAAGAVADCKAAGVETVMITGDHIETAYAIGKQLGIVKERYECMSGAQMDQLSDEELARALAHTRVFARVSPAQKVRIVDGLKGRGEIVAMTGDGINDAPSLKKADIGIAMGRSGTDVARQASDMILTDDHFATIRKAIEEGRGVYENIRKSVIFLLSSNLGEIITMFAAIALGLASPLKSSHILWINLITDSLPALALGIDQNDGASLMREKPRRSDESLFARGGLACTLFYGFLIAAISLAAFFLVPVSYLRAAQQDVTLPVLRQLLGRPEILAVAQTFAFTVLGMSQLFHAVGMRDTHKSFFAMHHLENKLMLLACVVGFALQWSVTEIPFLVRAFGTASLSLKEWQILVGLAAMPLVAHEVLVLAGKVRKRR